MHIGKGRGGNLSDFVWEGVSLITYAFDESECNPDSFSVDMKSMHTIPPPNN